MNKIGEQIRKLRKRKKLTLKQIADLTDFSASFISQVETGKSSITLESLMKISEALGVSPTYLFQNDEEESQKRNITVHKNQSVNGSDNLVNFKYKDLSGNFSNPSFLPTLITLQPRKEEVTPMTHKGQEFIFVLEGTLTIVLSDEEIELNPGDSIHMESTTPHNWLNRTDVNIKFLYVSSQ